MTRIRAYTQTLQATSTRRTTGKYGVALFKPAASAETAASSRMTLRGEFTEADLAPSIEDRFHDLVQQWKEETRFLSSVHQMVSNPSYLQIIGMGKEALPLLLKELRREPDHWFVALQAITGANPIPAAARGNLDAMAQAWLTWGDQYEK
jgi:hypothetical protein